MTRPWVRYLIFAYHAYYPCGGWADFQGIATTRAEATRQAIWYTTEEGGSYDRAEVVDLNIRDVVEYHLKEGT